MKNYIYVMHHNYAYSTPILSNSAQKIGSTKNPIGRFKTYYTYYVDRPKCFRLYEINKNCYVVDNLIQSTFAEYNVRANPVSGTEFYTLDLTTDMIEEFFRKNKISFKIIDYDELRVMHDDCDVTIEDLEFCKNEELNKIKRIIELTFLNTYYLSNGDKYRGETQNGMIHGHGEYTWSDNTKYEGNFRNGQISGFGRYMWKDGVEYEGDFENNSISGHGIYTMADGSCYKGEW